MNKKAAEKIPLKDAIDTTELETEAVIKIQSSFRGHKARKEVKQMAADADQH